LTYKRVEEMEAYLKEYNRKLEEIGVCFHLFLGALLKALVIDRR
jgi:hypothetical protein